VAIKTPNLCRELELKRPAAMLLARLLHYFSRLYFRRLTMSRMLFTQEIATLVALLVRNGRMQEAQLCCAEALKELDDRSFCSDLDHALHGDLY